MEAGLVSHFVQDYERHVSTLLKMYPPDEAMALAVGGRYEAMGQIEVDILRHAGLRDGMALADIGCGSGRLASALSKSGMEVDYLGTDIVQELLDYAAQNSSSAYKFKLHQELTIPVPDETLDMICAFSVLIHLNHHETFLYMKDMYRALKTGGKLVFSFLEFAEEMHWEIFEQTALTYRYKTLPALNAFIERPVIELWSQKLGFDPPVFIDATEAVKGSQPLGQAVAIVAKA
jgi:ubiquinone/menaquinone biosynthesis C-methylase UbiE